MIHGNIKRVLSAAMLLAFMAPATFALTETTGAVDTASLSSMSLSGKVALTDKNDIITLSLRDSDVKQVLRMFADKAGMNIVFHSSVNGKVTLDLVKTPINDAFNLVLQIANLSYYRQGNTMIILASSAPENANYSKQEMMTFPIKYVSAEKIADFLNKNVFGMKKAGMSGVDAATINSATNELIVFGMPSDAAIVRKVIDQFDREPFTKTFAVNHTTPAEMADMICNLLLPSRGSNGGKSSGGSAGSMTGGAASAGSVGTLKLGEGIVACSVSASQNGSIAPFDVQNLSIAYFPQRGTITLMGGSEAQANMIENFIKSNDIKQPQALLEVSVVELNESGSKEFQNAWSFTSKHWQAIFDGTSFRGGRPGGQTWTPRQQYIFDGGNNWTGMEMYNELPNGNPYTTVSYDENGNLSVAIFIVRYRSVSYDENGNRQVSVTVPQQVMRTIYQQLPSVHISWMMNYLIQNRKARVLSNPKIMITNGQESVIDLTQDYVEKVTSEYLTSALTGSGSSGTVQRTYSIGSDLGIKVSLTPFISPEGYVTLNIKPNYSTIAEQVYTVGPTGSNDLQATLLSRRDLDLKNIRIKDGETLVLGGLIQESDAKTVSKIPILGDLPFIGAAFRSTNTTKNKAELVIMITPKIINDGEGTIADSI